MAITFIRILALAVVLAALSNADVEPTNRRQAVTMSKPLLAKLD